jgi:hypothetical protein
MNTTLFALLGYFSLILLLLIFLLSYRTALVMQKQKAANAFKPDGSDVEGFPLRLTRALANCVESFPLIGGLMLFALATSSSSVTDELAYPLLVARLAQSLVHLISTSVVAVQLRFCFFVLQLVICGVWIVQLFIKFSA